MQFLDKLEQALMAILKWALIILLIAVTCSVSWGVFTRYVLNNASEWTFEFSGFVLAWITFLGAAYAILKGNHIRFETLFEMLPRKIRLAVHAILNSSVLIFIIMLTYYGFFLTLRSMGDETVSLPLSKGFFYSVLPVSGAFMILALFIDTVKAFRKEERKEVKGIEGDGLI